MAQDFNEIFDIGNHDLTLSTQEIDGITMVALQAVIVRNSALEDKLASTTTTIQTQQTEIDQLQTELIAIKSKLDTIK
jgi:hypothetical protein